ncbi:MAG: putative toxin-antitoxin system toxin component, PIN family [Gallionella sp.]
MLADFAKVVLDTNVLLSAALSPRGAPAELVDTLLVEGRLVFSSAIFAELESRIWKPKFDRYLPIERRKHILHELGACALWVDVPAAISGQSFSRDVKDDAFIHAALAAGVTRLVSGDDDLLCLQPLGTLHIITPRAALEEIGNLGRGV